jgi:hypothetical protein
MNLRGSEKIKHNSNRLEVPIPGKGGHCTIDRRCCNAKSKSKLCYDRLSVGQSILVSSPHLGSKARFFMSDSCGFVDVSTPSNEKMGLSFTIAVMPTISSEYSQTSVHERLRS